MNETADTEPAPAPDHEARIAALENRTDALEVRAEQHERDFDELERHLTNLITVLQDEVREAFRRRREGVTSHSG